VVRAADALGAAVPAAPERVIHRPAVQPPLHPAARPGADRHRRVARRPHGRQKVCHLVLPQTRVLREVHPAVLQAYGPRRERLYADLQLTGNDFQRIAGQQLRLVRRLPKRDGVPRTEDRPLRRQGRIRSRPSPRYGHQPRYPQRQRQHHALPHGHSFRTVCAGYGLLSHQRQALLPLDDAAGMEAFVLTVGFLSPRPGPPRKARSGCPSYPRPPRGSNTPARPARRR